MERKKGLDRSSGSVLENSQFLYSEDKNNNNNENYKRYQEELSKYEKNIINNQINNQSRKNGNLYHFQYSAQSEGKNEENNNSIKNNDLSTFTFGENAKNNLSLSNSNILSKTKNINQEALSFEDSNILNSSHLDLTNSISIKKENNLITKSQYVTFCNNYGDNSCYVNVILHLLFNITDLNNIFKDLYQIDEMEKETPKGDLISNTPSNASSNNATIIRNETQNNNPSTPLSLNNLFIEIGEILSDYEMYLNKDNTVQQVTTLDTKKFRENLEKISNGLFPLNYVADPVELFIYILENLNINYSREIHSNFHMELIDKVVCRRKCPNSYKNNFDKDNFLYQIYVGELMNYIKDNAIKFKNSKGDLFHLTYSLYTDDKKECENCTLLMEKFLLCLNVPKYLLLNCVWKNANPEIREVVDFLFLLSLEEDLNNLFICQNRTRNTDTNYSLLGMILYSYTLCHYTVLIFNKKEKVFALYNDNTVKEFKNLFDVFLEMLINNVNLYDNDKGYFYPVMLVYSKEKIYWPNDIRLNKLDEKEYVSLLNKIEENQKLYIQRHTLTEDQKRKNLEELIKKQREYEEEKLKKKSNNKKIIQNIDNNIDTHEEKDSNNKENDWMNYEFEEDKNKNSQNNLINNIKNKKKDDDDVNMTTNDYYKIYGNDLLKSDNKMKDYKNYFNELNNLNIDNLINKKNNTNIIGNNNEFLKDIHEQSNSRINNNLESSQRNYFNNNIDEIENNRLAQSQMIPSTKYFERPIVNNNSLNNNTTFKNNQNEIKTPMGKNNNTRKNNMNLSSSQQINSSKFNKNY